LDNQLIRLESNNNNDEIKEKERITNVEKFSSIPNMMKCYICEDYCEDAVQIKCCYENFCDKHIKEEIMKNFTCPNCKESATIKDLVPNKKLRETIKWFKAISYDSISIGMGLNKNIPANLTINNPVPPLITNQQNVNYMNYQVFDAARQQQEQNLQMRCLDKIEESNTAEMTTEEKMHFYNKFNEESLRKATEDKIEGKVDSENKSVSIEHKSVKDGFPNPTLIENKISQPNVFMPHYPPGIFPHLQTVNPLTPGMPGIPTMISGGQQPFQNPVAGVATLPGGQIPHNFPGGINPYFQRMDPRMYYMMSMGGMPMHGVYPMPLVPQPTDDKNKLKKSEKSSKSNSSSSEKSKSKEKRKRSKSRSRKKDRSKHRHRDRKDRDKEKDKREKDRVKDRDKDRDRERNKEKDRDKEKEKEYEKEKDRGRDRDKHKDKDKDRDRDKEKYKSKRY
jgi:hypothetical protein